MEVTHSVAERLAVSTDAPVAACPPVPNGDPAGILSRLRGPAEARPAADRLWCGGLREEIEDGLAPAAGALRPSAPVRLTWSSLVVGPKRCPDPEGAPKHPATWSRALDVLVRVAFRQWVVTGSIADPFADALAGLQVASDGGGVIRAIAGLGPRDQRRLRGALISQVNRLVEIWPTLDPRWAPRTDEHLLAPVAGGRVMLAAQVDLAIGHPAVDQVPVTFITATSGMVGSAPWRRLLFAALVETLRSGMAPWQVAVVSAVTGSVEMRQVTSNDLRALGQRVVTAPALASTPAFRPASDWARPAIRRPSTRTTTDRDLQGSTSLRRHPVSSRRGGPVAEPAGSRRYFPGAASRAARASGAAHVSAPATPATSAASARSETAVAS